VPLDIVEHQGRRPARRDDDQSLVEQGMEQRVQTADMVEHQKAHGPQRRPAHAIAGEKTVEIVQDRLRLTGRSRREQDQPRMMCGAELVQQWMRHRRRAQPFDPAVAHHPIHPRAFEEVGEVPGHVAAQGNYDGLAVDQTDQGADVLRRIVADDGDDFAGLHAG
jgi:hypothetical protein